MPTPPGRYRFLGALFILAAALFPALSSAEPVASLSEAGLLIVLSQTAGRYQISIAPEKGMASLKADLTANVFGIENPPRLVIDIPNQKARSAKSVAITDPFFAAIRTGIHSDKLRLVLDLKGSALPQYNISADTTRGALLITLDFGAPGGENSLGQGVTQESGDVTGQPVMQQEERTTAKSPPPSEPAWEESNRKALQTPPGPESVPPPLAPQPAETEPGRTPTVTEENSWAQEPDKPNAPEWNSQQAAPAAAEEKGQAEAVAPQPLEKSEATNLTAPVVSEDEMNQAMNSIEPGELPSGQARITGIYYQGPRDSTVSTVLIDVTGLTTYSLHQKDTDKYQLVLKNAVLGGQYLSLPQFPPDTFVGFQVILAQQQGQDVSIEIFVDDRMKVSPFMAKGKLWLKTSPAN